MANQVRKMTENAKNGKPSAKNYQKCEKWRTKCEKWPKVRKIVKKRRLGAGGVFCQAPEIAAGVDGRGRAVVGQGGGGGEGICKNFPWLGIY